MLPKFTITALAALASWIGSQLPSSAQVIPDATLGTQVNPADGNILTIQGGTRGGPHLFHSFQDFNIQPHQTVVFQDLGGLRTVLTRVTGQNPSTIDGTLTLAGPADFFLLNPNGIIFGPHAQLQLDGSFYASTATQVLFQDGLEFTVDAAETPLLTISQPIGLNLGTQPQPISVVGSDLEVQPGQDLALLGGSLALDQASLTAPGGVLRLTSLAEGGFVSIGSPDFFISPDLQLGTITILNRSRLDVVAGGGGDIILQGQDLVLGGSQLTAGIGPGLGDPLAQSGRIDIQMTGSAMVQPGTVIENNLGLDAQGDGGPIAIRAQNLSITNTRVSTSTLGVGNAGDLSIESEETLTIVNALDLPNPPGSQPGFLDNEGPSEGSPDSMAPASNQGPPDRLTSRLIEATSEPTEGSSNASNRPVDQQNPNEDLRIPLLPGLSLLSIGVTGDSGNLTFKAQTIQIQGTATILSEIRGTEASSRMLNGGDIAIEAQTLSLLEGPLISASVFSGLGKGGAISVVASDITLDATRSPAGVSSGGIISNLGRNRNLGRNDARGSAGSIAIETERLRLTGGVVIGADVIGEGTGDRDSTGGDIMIHASDSILLTTTDTNSRLNTPVISTALLPGTQGTGGRIMINTPKLQLNNGAGIIASTTGEGDGGDISIVADQIELQGVSPAGLPSVITANSNTGATGQGGNITIQTRHLSVQDGGQLSAATFSDQDGGSVTLEANQIHLSGSVPVPDMVRANRNLVTNVAGDRFLSGLFASSLGTGNVAPNQDALRIETRDLIVNNQAQISVSSTNAGAAGNLTLQADQIDLEAGRIVADTVEGDDANITINFRDHLRLSQQSQISTNASASATGGNIVIGSGSLMLEDGSAISAFNSGGVGNGGNILLNLDSIVANPGAVNTINADANQGDGGNIQITTNALFGQPFFRATASSDFGLDGVVEVESPEIDPAQGLILLPTNPLNSDDQVVAGCAADPQGDFYQVGRGGLPRSPNTLLMPVFMVVQARHLLSERVTQAQLADAAYWSGDYAKAVKVWEALVASEPDPEIQSVALSHLALMYHLQGQWDQAEQILSRNQALLTPQLINTQPHLYAQLLNVQGSLELAQGRLTTAIQTWTIASEYANPTQALEISLNQAQAFQLLGFQDKALQHLRALTTDLSTQPASHLFGLALLQQGNGLRSVGNLDEAQVVLDDSLELAKELHSSPLISASLLGLGHVARNLSQFNQADAYYAQAATLASSDQDRFQAHLSYLNLVLEQSQAVDEALLESLLSQAQHLPANRLTLYSQIQLAQLLLKLSNQNQLDRARSQELLEFTSKQARALADPLALSYSLGTLGHWYEQHQQWDQAQPLTEEALWLAQQVDAPEAAYLWSWQLGRILQDPDQQIEAMTAYRESVRILKTIRTELASINTDIQFSFRDQVEPVYRQLTSLLLGSTPLTQAHLIEARLLIEDLQLAELNDFFQDDCTQTQPIAADTIDPTAAVIYPILLEDRLDLIVSISGQPLSHRSVAITPAQIEATADQLLRSLTTPLRSSQPETRQSLQDVYSWLVAPVQALLDDHAIETLVFVADGPLRTLPLAALYDGQQYLIETYNVVLSPGLELLDPRPLPRQNLQLLVGGLSQARANFSSLPFVEDEVTQVATLIPEHRLYLNESLTIANLEADLSTSSADVIHLATHGEFGTSAEETFILTWDGRLTIKDLGILLQRSPSASPVELLVLSACDTAAGNSRAILGIAGMAIRADTRSVVAGLWPLNDQATAVFMSNFYQTLALAGTTKSQAFRQAQLALLQDPKFQAPYYWSPYVLVGNWL